MHRKGAVVEAVFRAVFEAFFGVVYEVVFRPILGQFLGRKVGILGALIITLETGKVLKWLVMEGACQLYLNLILQNRESLLLVPSNLEMNLYISWEPRSNIKLESEQEKVREILE